MGEETRPVSAELLRQLTVAEYVALNPGMDFKRVAAASMEGRKGWWEECERVARGLGGGQKSDAIL